jgi:hypothetical protein
MFVATMKTGRHQGKGRPVLPPMPVQVIRNLTASDFSRPFPSASVKKVLIASS